MPAPDVALAGAELDEAQERATIARLMAQGAEEEAATALTGYNEALRHA